MLHYQLASLVRPRLNQVSLGDAIGDGSWSIRIYHKPFVAWIWWGAVLMVFGGLLAAGDRRYRIAARKAMQASREVTASGAQSA